MKTMIPEQQPAEVPYFARRKRLPKFKTLDDGGKMGRGTDATEAISEDRDDRL